MKAKPMLAKGSVVRNILAGLQTQDRRPIKPQPTYNNDATWSFAGDRIDYFVYATEHPGERILKLAPHQPGDILWIREPWAAFDADWRHPGKPHDLKDGPWPNVAYGATQDLKGFGRPSIHMPKWACRLFLKVTAVRAQRIKDISEAGAMSEGVRPIDISSNNGPNFYTYEDDEGMSINRPTAREVFAYLWDCLYFGSWARNEWVWVYEFEITDKPADWPGN